MIDKKTMFVSFIVTSYTNEIVKWSVQIRCEVLKKMDKSERDGAEKETVLEVRAVISSPKKDKGAPVKWKKNWKSSLFY